MNILNKARLMEEHLKSIIDSDDEKEILETAIVLNKLNHELKQGLEPGCEPIEDWWSKLIIAKAKQALDAVREYEQDWNEMGVNRVYKYYNDVDGDWLEEWDK